MRLKCIPPFGTPYHEVTIAGKRRRTAVFSGDDVGSAEALAYGASEMQKLLEHPTVGPTVNGTKRHNELRLGTGETPRKYFHFGTVILDQYIEHHYSGVWTPSRYGVTVIKYINGG